MDPNATLENLLSSVLDGEYWDAYEDAQNLKEWLTKGGFQPKLSNNLLITLLEHFIARRAESDSQYHMGIAVCWNNSP